ncbi:MAG TPA: AAA family ATPase, partial [Chloroflexota bacterium]|nr:AAA family ATPase [Chloroflexota bacterium]
MLQINLLGVPEVCLDGVHRNVPKGQTLALLAYLAVEGGMHPRESLVALLWPEMNEQEGRTNLRSTLSMLRKALGEQTGRPAVLRAVGNAIGLEPSAFLVDVHALASAAALARPGTAVPDLRSQLEHAVAAWHGPLLNGVNLRAAPDFETWVLGRREDAHCCMSEILARLASIYADAGDPAAAVAALERWVRLDALNEEAHRRLLAAHLAAGNITAGLRAYDACRTVVARELGREPNPQIQTLAGQLDAAAHRPAADPAPHTSVSGFLPEPPPVGRAPELVALRGCFAQAQQGQAQAVVLSGEFGIGKTCLARDFLTTIRAQGGDVLQGQAFELSESVPYAAVVEAVRPRLERENAPEDLLDDLWLAALTRMLPELCARYPDLAAAAAGSTKAQLFEAIARLVHALAEQQPVVLFLDDAQWIDGATRELVQYALRRWVQCGTRVLLLLAVRAEDVATTATLAAWLEQLDRTAPTTRLVLGPLTPTATIRLVGALAGAEPPGAQQAAGESAEARFGAWLAAETGGHPFFIVETLKELLNDGAVALRPDAARGWAFDLRGTLRGLEGLQRQVPARVQEVIMTRLGRLGQPARALLVAGAVLGTHFTFEQVCRVAELSEREALEGLDEAVRAHLLREDALAGYTFCYDVLRAVVNAQAGAAWRQVFWRRARALLTDQVSTAPWSDQGATA